jgi:hypothetical protein
MLSELRMERGPDEQRAPEGPGRDIFSCVMFLAVAMGLVGFVVWLLPKG